MFQAPGYCPSCEALLGIRELGCPNCGTSVRGRWAPGPFQRLNADQQAFLILFVRSRGNLSEVERALGVSYPTVRAKLEELISALEDTAQQDNEPEGDLASSRRAVLDRVASGEIDAAEALELLKQQRRSEGSSE
jgi:hypothetical protein